MMLEKLRQKLNCRDRPALRDHNARRTSMALVCAVPDLQDLDGFLQTVEEQFLTNDLEDEERVYVRRQVLRDLLHGEFTRKYPDLVSQLIARYVDLLIFENDVQQADALLVAAAELRKSGNELGQLIIQELREECQQMIEAWKEMLERTAQV